MVDPSTSLRVMLVSSQDRGGGAEAVARTLHAALRNRGHDSNLIVGSAEKVGDGIVEINNEASRSRWERRWSRQATRMASENPESGWSHKSSSLLRMIANPNREAGRLIGLEDFHFPGTSRLSHIDPNYDIIHLHNLHGGYFDLRQLPILSRVTPTLITLHDQWMLTGHCAISFDCERWRMSCGNCPYLDTYPAVRRDATRFNLTRKKEIYQDSRLYVSAPSRWLLDQVEDSVLESAVVAKKHIPLGVDHSIFTPGDRWAARHHLGLAKNQMVILFVAHRAKSNQFRDWRMFVSALKILAERSDRRIVAIIIGDEGPQEAFGAITLRWVGQVDNARDLADWYRASDVVAHPTRGDSFSLTVLEAMACGVPVVATAVGAVVELVEGLDLEASLQIRGESHPTATGILVEPVDAHSLAAALDLLLGTDELRLRIGENAAIKARRFSWDRYIDETISWYWEVLDDRITQSKDYV